MVLTMIIDVILESFISFIFKSLIIYYMAIISLYCWFRSFKVDESIIHIIKTTVYIYIHIHIYLYILAVIYI